VDPVPDQLLRIKSGRVGSVATMFDNLRTEAVSLYIYIYIYIYILSLTFY
jgi:hypothetical protein